MSQKNKRIFSTLILFSFILFCFSSCGVKAEQKSLTSNFEIIDALISQNQLKDAVKQLKKIEKKAFDYWSFIGIYKRYNQLGEDKLCEKVLKKALKKNESNPELHAVYASFLTKNDRFEEALEIAKVLRGTKYGSIYSEAYMRNVQGDVDSNVYYKDDFYQIYLDAYNGSENPVWLRNVAVMDMKKGFFQNAAMLDPGFYANSLDAYFWSIVLYDSGRYYESINTLELAKKYLNDFKSTTISPIILCAIESDAYNAVSDIVNAEKVRQEIICNLDNLKVLPEDESYLSAMVINSAIYAQNQQNADNCADLLFYAVNRWPDYVPGLILYADFAYTSNLQRKEDKELENLRLKGIKTLEMEKYDSRRKIPMSDALYRIDASIQRNKDPYLAITKLDLKYKMNPDVTEKEKERDLWQLLEDNYSESEKYKLLLIEYVTNYFMYKKQYEDAWNLFYKYVIEHSTIKQDGDFWSQFISQISYFDLGIIELAGWFAAKAEKIDEAVRIYEYCVYESAGILPDGMISPRVSTGACMNLANIYFATERKNLALDLYGKAAGREVNNSRRSDIFYRIANIYVSLGDNKNALRSIDYACSIYPENAKASLLKDLLK